MPRRRGNPCRPGHEGLGRATQMPAKPANNSANAPLRSNSCKEPPGGAEHNRLSCWLHTLRCIPRPMFPNASCALLSSSCGDGRLQPEPQSWRGTLHTGRGAPMGLVGRGVCKSLRCKGRPTHDSLLRMLATSRLNTGVAGKGTCRDGWSAGLLLVPTHGRASEMRNDTSKEVIVRKMPLSRYEEKRPFIPAPHRTLESTPITDRRPVRHRWGSAKIIVRSSVLSARASCRLICAVFRNLPELVVDQGS